jgi:ATP-dependent DNA helicase RecG
MVRNSKLNTSIEYVKGVGPARAEWLKKELGIFTFYDLLNYFPFRYVDKSRFYNISEIQSTDQFFQLRGVITDFEELGAKRAKRLTAVLTDNTGSMELVWFKGIKWIRKFIQPGLAYIVYGKPASFNGKLNIAHPEVDLYTEGQNLKPDKFQPVYATTEKLKNNWLDSKGIRKAMQHLFLQLGPSDIPEILPEYILKKYRLVNRWTAYKNIHFPINQEQKNQAVRRLKFEELFLLQMNILKLRVNRQKIKGAVFSKLGEYFNGFYHNVLHLELTNAQKKVIREIRQDLGSGIQMNRLLQGDVGSGKTIVALLSMLMALDNGYQACLMAPTEILAQQHYNSISAMIEPLGLSADLLTGSVKGKTRKGILEKLKTGETHILIGTHALLEDKVIYSRLGFVVIDEQHRFGVAQRAKLWQKSKQTPPHILVMTATPIPRTLAMTLYGDLDVSIIDELPPGRKPISTHHMHDSHRLQIFGLLRKEIQNGRQAYVVYPLIRESEKMDYKDLEDGYESIVRSFPLPEYRVSILHGQMDPKAKEFEMARFVKGETHIMVSTTVIEVGVDVPNASVMIIESAERFGLSQLHQLRGRVGRGADKSYCILVSGNKLSTEARKRLKTMTETNDGFRIAEVDMEIRGPGVIEGTRQSGHLNLKIANIQTDLNILTEARKTATEIMTNDPELVSPEHHSLKTYLQQPGIHKTEWSKIL